MLYEAKAYLKHPHDKEHKSSKHIEYFHTGSNTLTIDKQELYKYYLIYHIGNHKYKK